MAVVVAAPLGCGGDGAHPAAPAGPRLTDAVARRLQASLASTVRETGVPGASAAVVFPNGDEWAGAAGRAVLRPSRPMTTRTALPFDSVTKIATAALAMRLVERHRLSLDDPIARWFGGWRGDRRATVRDLLGHTAGLRDPSLGAATRARSYIDTAPKPGHRTTAAVYSNTGFVIAGMIIARAAGEPVAKAMRRELFNQPGGAGLALQPGEQPRPPIAHSYRHPPGTVEPVPPERSRVMSHRSRIALDSIDGHTMIGHEGAGFGSHSELWHLPRENLTIAVTWNDDVVGRDANALPALVRIALADAN